MVTSIAFNLCFVALWFVHYGARRGHAAYMSDLTTGATVTATEVTLTEMSATVVTTEPAKPRKPKKPDDDDD